MILNRKYFIQGAGIAGLNVAYQLLRYGINGNQIILVDRASPNVSAAYFSAGMLAPNNELEFGEEAIMYAGLESRKMYDDYEAKLGDIGLTKEGSIEVGITPDDQQYVYRQYQYQKKFDLEVEWIDQKKHLQQLLPHLHHQGCR